MFTKILLPFSLFIISHVYIFCLVIKKTELILTDDSNKLQNYLSLMKDKSDITILMIILVIIYSTFGGLLTII